VEDRPLDEQRLIARAQRGDVHAYEELVRNHQTIAFRTAVLVSGNVADAQEAAQDGFLKAYRALGRFRLGAPFRPWLLQIVANEARNRAAASGRRERLAICWAEERRPGDAVPSPEAALLGSERRDAPGQVGNGRVIETVPELKELAFELSHWSLPPLRAACSARASDAT